MNTEHLVCRRKTLALLSAALVPNAVKAAGAISLPLAPTPENAPRLAERAVSATLKIEGVVLDYSHESLKHIDKRVLAFRDEGNAADSIGSTLFVFGCYVGEVMVRQLGARWEMPGETERNIGFEWMGIRASNGSFWNPIGKVFKLLKNGDEDSVWYLFTVVKSQ